MRRRLLIILAFLLVGAVINVAVAWISVFPLHGHWEDQPFSEEEVERISRRFAPATWPTDFHAAYRSVGHVSTFEMIVSGGDQGTERSLFGGPVWMIEQVSYGWPWRCLHGVTLSDNDAVDDHRWLLPLGVPLGLRDPPSIDLPLCPIWPGFAANTLLYAATTWLLLCGPFALRRLVRRKRGLLCVKCAYPIGPSPKCSECGAEVARSVPAAHTAR